MPKTFAFAKAHKVIHGPNPLIRFLNCYHHTCPVNGAICAGKRADLVKEQWIFRIHINVKEASKQLNVRSIIWEGIVEANEKRNEMFTAVFF